MSEGTRFSQPIEVITKPVPAQFQHFSQGTASAGISAINSSVKRRCDSGSAARASALQIKHGSFTRSPRSIDRHA
jgi:hypothetical protein